jgi:hypothetical protein
MLGDMAHQLPSFVEQISPPSSPRPIKICPDTWLGHLAHVCSEGKMSNAPAQSRSAFRCFGPERLEDKIRPVVTSSMTMV